MKFLIAGLSADLIFRAQKENRRWLAALREPRDDGVPHKEFVEGRENCLTRKDFQWTTDSLPVVGVVFKIGSTRYFLDCLRRDQLALSSR